MNKIYTNNANTRNKIHQSFMVELRKRRLQIGDCTEVIRFRRKFNFYSLHNVLYNILVQKANE